MHRRLEFLTAPSAACSSRCGSLRIKVYSNVKVSIPTFFTSAAKTGVVDAGIISPPSNLQGLKIGLKEMIDVSDLGIVFVNSPLSTTRSYIKNNRDIVLRMLRAYCDGIQQARSDKDSAIKILAKNAKVEDPEV